MLIQKQSNKVTNMEGKEGRGGRRGFVCFGTSVLSMYKYRRDYGCYFFPPHNALYILVFLAVALFLVHFLHLHPPVLKPDFDLPLGQIQDPCDLVSAVSCEVHIEQKLLFQFQSLVLCVRTAFLPCGTGVYPICHRVICKKKKRKKKSKTSKTEIEVVSKL